MSESARQPLAPPPPPPVSSPASGRRLPPPPPLPVSRPVPPRAPSSVVFPARGHRSQSELSDEERKLAMGSALRSVPSWLMSAVVHLSVMVVLGLLYVAQTVNKQQAIEIVANPSWDQLGDP